MRLRREGSLGYFEILLEEMNGKFSLVLEGHDAIRKEFNEQLSDIREQQGMFMSLLKVSHDELKEEIQSVREELREEMITGFKAVGDKVDGHEDRIHILERKAA
jgi:uncharacterized protein YdcH (DUF465 family)